MRVVAKIARFGRLARFGRFAVLRPYLVRAGLTALPLLSLGLLCPVPSLVMAVRGRGGGGRWWACAAFSAVLAAWLTELALTPEDTHGLLFANDLLLILLSTVGASVHAWTAWPRRPVRHTETTPAAIGG
ncbi:hypothetical protein [Streptomyces mexicanus]|uniref:Uncharacterized protein n=1 Tax=Streptomyces mexicanus TaxID=178566 RepID=A0A7X1LTH0_9ACTN|nr:hypothetical protein [Streptomyces mexicanus]MBC2869138.1 hypothetical protein [Streptomyces mexicanus]